MLFTKSVIRKFLLGLFGILTLLAVGASVLHQKNRRLVQTQIANWKALGYPTNLAEYNQFLGEVPDEDNARINLQNEQHLKLNYSILLTNADVLTLHHVTGNQRLQLEKTLENLMEAAGKKTFRSAPVDPTRPLAENVFGGLANVSGAVLFLGSRMRYDLQEGRQEEAVKFLEKAMSLASMVFDDPLSISYVVASRAQAIAVHDLAYLISATSLTPSQNEHLQRLFRDLVDSDQLKRGLSHDGLLLLEFQRMSVSEQWGALAQFRLLSPLVASDASLNGGKWSASQDLRFWMEQLRLGTYQSRGGLEQDLIVGLQKLTAYRELLDEPHQFFGERREAWVQSIDPRRRIPATLLPSIELGEVALRARSLLRIAQTLLLLDRYRHSHEEWPESLDSLLPDFAPALPIDPFSGESIQYQKTLKGFRVYSAGPDGLKSGKPQPKHRHVEVEVGNEL